MSRPDAERISDMLAACDELREIVSRGRTEFDSDPVLRRATERLLEIIGEAAGSVSPEFAEAHPSLPLSDAKAMRNLLSHEYWRGDPDDIWDTSAYDVPALAAQLQEILDETGHRTGDAPMAPDPALSLLERAGSNLLPRVPDDDS